MGEEVCVTVKNLICHFSIVTIWDVCYYFGTVGGGVSDFVQCVAGAEVGLVPRGCDKGGSNVHGALRLAFRNHEEDRWKTVTHDKP